MERSEENRQKRDLFVSYQEKNKTSSVALQKSARTRTGAIAAAMRTSDLNMVGVYSDCLM